MKTRGGSRPVVVAAMRRSLQDAVKSWIANRVQLTTDGFKICLEAVESAFGEDIDYAMLQKICGSDS